MDDEGPVFVSSSKCGAPLKDIKKSKKGSSATKAEDSDFDKSPQLGVRTCNFGLTFKSDPASGNWLLYQEYRKE